MLMLTPEVNKLYNPFSALILIKPLPVSSYAHISLDNANITEAVYFYPSSSVWNIKKIEGSKAINCWLSFEDCRKQDNLKKLDAILSAENNWNGYGAAAFSSNLITKVKSIIRFLSIQPKVFPTSRNSIQLEYENTRGAYLEFEIFESYITIFTMDQDENETENIFVGDTNELDGMVKAFYG